MALVRSVDALDVYIRSSNRKPFLFQSPSLKAAIDGAHLSVFKKIGTIEEHYPTIDGTLYALINVMIAWRNRAAHLEADKDIADRHRDILKACFVEIAMRFRNLDTAQLLLGYEKHDAPTFKEIASFINATHHFVEALERCQFEALNAEVFLKEMIWEAVSTTRVESEHVNNARRRHLRSIWGKAPTDRPQSVRRFLQHKGLSFERPSDGSPIVVFEDLLIDEIVSKTPTEMFEWAKT